MSALAEAPAPEMMGLYRVRQLLGEGGMGRVYLGEHTLIGRRVAIKVLSPEVAAEAEIVSRFFTEARAVGELRHPNIVEVTDFGTHEGLPFIVMEYLEGETLAERLRWQGPTAEEAIVRIARQIASALGAVHERGVVHRDLKPANIFLREHPDYPDFVKILDFGIAKLVGAGGGQSHRTQVGMALGTPAYMSPEQCLGEASLDARSDVYSLGVVLYEMATGTPPFAHEAVGRVFMGHVQEQAPDPRTRRSDLSAGMSALILRALAKKPADRFATMREVRAALEALAWPTAPAMAVARTLPAVTSAPITVPLRILGASARSGVARVTPPRLAAPTVAPSPALDAERLSGLVRARLDAGGLQLPSPSPALALGLEMTQSPSFSFPAALALARRDPRLQSLVIRMANVEPYGGRSPALGLEQAIARLGAQGLCVVCVEMLARPAIENRTPRFEAFFRRPWPHALAGALIARRLVQADSGIVEPVDGYLAALLRDVGRPAVAQIVSDIERRSPENASRRPLPEESFVACIEAHHAAARRALLDGWRLPATVVDAGAEAPTSSAGRRLALIVSLAAALADAEGFTLRQGEPGRLQAALAAARAAAGIDDAVITRATQRVKEWVLSRG